MRRGNVKNMGDIKDFNCTYDNSAGIRSEVTEGLGLTFPDAYASKLSYNDFTNKSVLSSIVFSLLP